MIDVEVKEELRELRKKIEGVESALRNVELYFKELTEWSGGFASVFKRIDDDLKILANRATKQEVEIQGVKEEVNDVKKQVLEVKSEVGIVHDGLKAVQGQVTSVKEELWQQIEKVKGDQVLLDKDLNEVLEKLSALQKENDKLRKQNELLERRLKVVEEDFESYRKRFNALLLEQTQNVKKEVEAQIRRELYERFNEFADAVVKYFHDLIAKHGIKSGEEVYLNALKAAFERAKTLLFSKS